MVGEITERMLHYRDAGTCLSQDSIRIGTSSTRTARDVEHTSCHGIGVVGIDCTIHNRAVTNNTDFLPSCKAIESDCGCCTICIEIGSTNKVDSCD